MTLKVKVNELHFQYQSRLSQDARFGANLDILAQIRHELFRGPAEFPRIQGQICQTDLEGQGQWPPFLTPANSIPGCVFGANLLILAQIYHELLLGQAEFLRIPSQNGQNDLEGQGQWPPFSIPTESIPGCMFGANLVIPAQICNEWSCGQGNFYRQTDGRMDRRRQRQYPFGLKGQRVKMKTIVLHWCLFLVSLYDFMWFIY